MSAGGAPGTRAPAPLPADVGIVAALPIEVAPLLARLKDPRRYASERHAIYEGSLAGKLVALIVAGPGRKAARRGAELILGGHRPRWLISAGFGGALDPALRRGDVVVATEVIDPDGLRLAIDARLAEDPSPKARLLPGRLLTVDRIVRTAADKADLRRRFEADAVDMETAAVASLCGDRGVRFLALRVISDEAGVDLPPEVLTILGPTGGFRVGAAVGAIWRRPASLKALWTLREHAHASADRLATVLPGIIAQLS